MTADPLTANTFIQFSSPTFSVRQIGKFVKVTVSLTGKFSGLVTADFSAADGTAQAGFDYMPVATRLEFTNKKISAVVAIPIIAGLPAQPSKTVVLTLQNPTGGALLGANHGATPTILP